MKKGRERNCLDVEMEKLASYHRWNVNELVINIKSIHLIERVITLICLFKQYAIRNFIQFQNALNIAQNKVQWYHVFEYTQQKYIP